MTFKIAAAARLEAARYGYQEVAVKTKVTPEELHQQAMDSIEVVKKSNSKLGELLKNIYLELEPEELAAHRILDLVKYLKI